MRAAGGGRLLPAALSLVLAAAAAALADPIPPRTPPRPEAPISLEEMVRAVAKVPVGPDASAVGTGVLISPTHILTSAHVLAGCGGAVVTNRRIGSVPARILRRESRRDSAVLSVAVPQPFHLRREAPPRPRAGEALRIVGFPAGRPGSEGPVSQAAQFRSLRSDEAGIPVVEMSASAEPGMSGAPVLDARGALVGILVGRLDARPGDVVALSVAGLSEATRRLFADAPAVPAGLSVAAVPAKAPFPIDAIVKIHCR